MIRPGGIPRCAELLLAVLGLCLVAGTNGLAAQPRKPNVLFIALDDWNDWAGCLGHGQALTPNADRLAGQGMLFTGAHCVAPVCNPSRVAVMTGLRPETTGVYENHQPLGKKKPDAVTLQLHFAQSGYATYGGGKIYHDSPQFIDLRGWTEYYWWHPKGNVRDDYSHPPDPEPPGRPTRNITPITKRNFDWGPVDQPEADWPDTKVAHWAAGVLERKHDEPFFLAVGIFRPHVPWFNPPKYFDVYPLDRIRLPAVKDDDLEDLGPFARARAMDRNSQHEKLVEFGEWKPAVQAYLGSISFADANLGRVLDALDRSPHKDNTIVVLWSDHGYHLGEKLHWHKRTLWERSTHVPLIWVVPGTTKPGSVCDAPVSLLDMYPTLIDLCGLKPRAELEGRSLVPLLGDPNAPWDRPAVTTWQPGNVAVRSRHFRYIRYAKGEEELYDHRTDPDEWHNLAGDPRYAGVIAEHRRHLPGQKARGPD
jgi:arylsulfatase A-like enzyme